jgi:hypothetical protein
VEGEETGKPAEIVVDSESGRGLRLELSIFAELLRVTG